MNVISISEEIADVFNIFHDGVIVKYEYVSNILKLDIEIPYLATRIQKHFNGFNVEISNCENVSFKPWNLDGDTGECIHNVEQIFNANLEVLSAEFRENIIIIHVCLVSRDFGYGGGVLMFTAGSLKVCDQLGNYYSYDELGSLCDEYWTEWENNNSKSPGA